MFIAGQLAVKWLTTVVAEVFLVDCRQMGVVVVVTHKRRLTFGAVAFWRVDQVDQLHAFQCRWHFLHDMKLIPLVILHFQICCRWGLLHANGLFIILHHPFLHLYDFSQAGVAMIVVVVVDSQTSF